MMTVADLARRLEYFLKEGKISEDSIVHVESFYQGGKPKPLVKGWEWAPNPEDPKEADVIPAVLLSVYTSSNKPKDLMTVRDFINDIGFNISDENPRTPYEAIVKRKASNGNNHETFEFVMDVKNPSDSWGKVVFELSHEKIDFQKYFYYD